MKPKPTPSSPDDTKPSLFPVVGIGFSAGGLDALKKFFEGVLPNGNGAYVVIQHLRDKGESQLYEILEKIAPLPVCKLTDGQKLQAGTIHVLGTCTQVTMREGIVHFTTAAKSETNLSSIDHFFGSLAREEAEMVMGVILSGSGTDGTVGLQKIKAAGGMCLVQDPNEADFPGMPQSAIQSGCIDFVGTATKLAERAEHYFNHRHAHQITADSLEGEKGSILVRMLCLIRARTGNDFRDYKRSSIVRRIQRRMSLSDTTDFAGYLEYLRQNDREVKDLARDILISVTCFFRDPDVWHSLENETIPRIIESKQDGDEIRVWVAGCATGEEVYSYGILFSEAIERSGKSLILQVYGTDIDDHSREVARAATYPAAIIHDVGQDRVRNYFSAVGSGRYKILQSLREKITFAKQNILTDPPFSRMDLVSCRNLLIYLDANMQKRVINLLHFALNEGGIAVLGTAESTGRQPEGLFKPVNRELRIYERIGDKSYYSAGRHHNVLLSHQASLRENPSLRVPANIRSIEETSRSLIMEHFCAASALVDKNLSIRYLSGKTDLYLRHPEGTPTNDLSVLVNAAVGHKIRRVAKQVFAEKKPFSFSAKLANTSFEKARISVKPARLDDGEDGLFIVFETLPDVIDAKDSASMQADVSEPGNDGELLSDMDRELKEAQYELRTVVEDLASANEELKSSNEEVMSMNEELQSSNEELETSKEELQSLNDELTSVNKELLSKVNELEVTNNDMDNLLSSTDIATIFLDENLRIKLFTSACSRHFNLIASDIGRPISDLVAKFDGDNLVELCQNVLQDLERREDEIHSPDDGHYLRRISPYRTKKNRIEGIVVTFSDVSKLKSTEANLVEAERCLRLSIQNSNVTIFAQNRNLEYTYILNAHPSISKASILGKRDRDILPDDYHTLDSLKSKVLESGTTMRERIAVFEKTGRTHWFDLTLEALRDEQGAITGIAGAAVDITEQAEREAELKAANDAKSNFLSSMSHDVRTPLTAIMGLAEILEDTEENHQREIGEEIKNSCNHLISTLDSVLNLAHLQGGQIKLSLEPIELDTILQEVCDSFDPKRKQANGKQRIHLATQETGLSVMAEHGALLRVLSNLIGNALKFCPDAPIFLRVTQEAEQVKIEVEDSGPGISKDFIQDIFKPFTQEANAKNSSLPGSGLGLSICHELVQMLNGSIHVESELGKGTKMVVALPLCRRDAMPAKEKLDLPSQQPTGLRALVCDDHEATCTVIRRMLRDHDVTVVNSEKQLYENMDGVEVLLLDINLHGKHRGVEIMKTLRKNPKYQNLRIIAFTAHALPEHKESFIKEGFDGYMSKPFRKAELIEKIMSQSTQ